MFNFLNIVDYWPDNKLEKEKNFRAFMSNSQHAAYTNEFLTRDERFARRMNTFYEYLNIGTYISYFILEQLKEKDG